MKNICSICTKDEEGNLPKSDQKNLKWMSIPCISCQELMTKGFILIGAVEAKTEDVTNPYRSGNIWVVKQEVAVQLFGEKLPPAGIAFIDVTVAAQMELPGVNLNA